MVEETQDVALVNQEIQMSILIQLYNTLGDWWDNNVTNNKNMPFPGKLVNTYNGAMQVTIL